MAASVGPTHEVHPTANAAPPHQGSERSESSAQVEAPFADHGEWHAHPHEQQPGEHQEDARHHFERSAVGEQHVAEQRRTRAERDDMAPNPSTNVAVAAMTRCLRSASSASVVRPVMNER